MTDKRSTARTDNSNDDSGISRRETMAASAGASFPLFFDSLDIWPFSDEEDDENGEQTDSGPAVYDSGEEVSTGVSEFNFGTGLSVAEAAAGSVNINSEGGGDNVDEMGSWSHQGIGDLYHDYETSVDAGAIDTITLPDPEDSRVYLGSSLLDPTDGTTITFNLPEYEPPTVEEGLLEGRYEKYVVIFDAVDDVVFDFIAPEGVPVSGGHDLPIGSISDTSDGSQVTIRLELEFIGGMWIYTHDVLRVVAPPA